MPKKTKNRFLDLAIVVAVLLICSAIAFNIFYFNYIGNLNNKETETEVVAIKKIVPKKVDKIESGIFTEKILEKFTEYETPTLPEFTVGNTQPFRVENEETAEKK